MSGQYVARDAERVTVGGVGPGGAVRVVVGADEPGHPRGRGDGGGVERHREERRQFAERAGRRVEQHAIDARGTGGGRRGMVQPEDAPERVADDEPLTVAGVELCELRVEGGTPGREPGRHRVRKFGQLDVAAGRAQLGGEPALPVRAL